MKPAAGRRQGGAVVLVKDLDLSGRTDTRRVVRMICRARGMRVKSTARADRLTRAAQMPVRSA